MTSDRPLDHPILAGDEDDCESVFLSRCSLACDFCNLPVVQAVHSCGVGVNMDPTCINICLPCLDRLQALTVTPA
jgi:hypothetical protein